MLFWAFATPKTPSTNRGMMLCYLNTRLPTSRMAISMRQEVQEVGHVCKERRESLSIRISPNRRPGGSALPHAIEETRTRMKFWLPVILLLFLSVAKGSARRHTATPAALSDPSYVFALGTANRFLHAWQTGDLETGTVLLSDNVRRSRSAGTLERFFSAGPDRAYEIDRGKGNPARYRFPVVLITKSSGLHCTFSEMVLVNTGKNDWAVDKLP